MNGRHGVCVLLSFLLGVHTAGGFSGDAESYRSWQYGHRVPVAPVYRHVDSQGREHALKFDSASLRAQSRARIAKLMPSALLESRFRQVPHDRSGVSFLARTDHEVHVENAPLSASHIITMVSHCAKSVSVGLRFRQKSLSAHPPPTILCSAQPRYRHFTLLP